MAGVLVTEDSNAPPELELDEVPLALDFHPTANNVLAVGSIDGSVRVSRFTCDAHEPAFLVATPFDSSAGGVRSVRFSQDGQVLWAGAADHSIVGLSPTGALAWRNPTAHRDAVSKVTLIDEHLIGSGDDSGAVKVWDARQAPERPVMAFDLFQDYVSDLLVDQVHHPGTLLGTSGDGTLAAFDLRQHTCLGRSNDLEEDLLSVQVVKGGRKVVCGTSEGVLLLFSWDNWDGATDSFPGHPESVGALLKVDESTILTGSSDGMVRVVGLMPSKLYGLVGDHQGFPLERMAWSSDRNLLGTISHDPTVRFWDVTYLHEDDEEGDGEEMAEEAGAADAGAMGDQTSAELLRHIRARQEAAAAAGGGGADDDGWEDEDESGADEMSGSDSDEDSDGPGASGGGARTAKGKNAQYRTPAQSFFQDL